ncbi:MAG: SDR family NAD(P)-dependent oxidoreductase [Acidimicrobiales bacterium]
MIAYPAGAGRRHAASAVVVGGGSGIGAELAARYRGAGTPVLVWDIAGPHDVRCDISDPAQVEEASRVTLERIGVPAHVTVCAGVGHSGLLLDLDPSEWDRVIAVNARGPMLAMRSIAGSMIEDGSAGSIVAVSSVSARIPDRSMGSYCASKAALSMLVKVAAAEWAGAGIRVNAVAPGVTDTPMLGGVPLGTGWLERVAHRTALGRIGTPGEIAEAILAVHGMEWVTGQIIECDGGLSLHSPIDPMEGR